jgi:hypothetical protein
VSGTGSDVARWAGDHGACFEVEPLIELLRGRRVQVGFIVRLYARLPLEERSPAERRAEAAEIQARLREMLQSIAPPEGSSARLEIEPSRTGVSLAPEGGLQPEVGVSARVFHGEDYSAEVTEGEEKRVHAATRRLAEMGLKERRSRIP